MAKHTPSMTQEDIASIIKQLHGDVGPPTAGSGRFGASHRQIQLNREDVFHDDAAAPDLPKPYESTMPRSARYQYPFISRQHEILKSAFVSNHGIVRCVSPSAHVSDQDRADRAETVLMAILRAAERKANTSFGGLLADGQSLWKYGILSARKAALLDAPELEYRDDLPEDDDKLDTAEAKARNQRTRDRYQPSETDDHRAKGKYRERDKVYQERHKRAKAAACDYWDIRVIDPATFSYVEDVNHVLCQVVVVREVALLDYESDIHKDKDSKDVYLNVDRVGRVTGFAGSRPPDWLNVDGSNEGWGQRRVTLAEFWTKDEWYELVAGDGANSSSGWRLVPGRCGTHPYGRPPFWIVAGRETDDPRPEKRHQPIFQDMFDAVRKFNRDMQLAKILVEESAIPKGYPKPDKDMQQVSDEGLEVEVSPHTAKQEVWPPGVEYIELKRDISAGFMRLIDMEAAMLKELLPLVGIAEHVTGTSAPWTVRQEMAQASVIRDKVATNQANGFAGMLNMMCRVMALPVEEDGFGEGVYVLDYQEVDHNGKARKIQNVVGLEPDEWEGLQVEYDIDTTMPAEVIVLEQHYREMLGLGLVTEAQYYEEGAHRANATAQIKATIIDRTARLIRDGVIKQEIAAAYGDKFVVSADGTAIDNQGRPITPQQALQMKGVTPISAATPNGGGQNQTRMPDQGRLAAPETLPLEGLRG